MLTNVCIDYLKLLNIPDSAVFMALTHTEDKTIYIVWKYSTCFLGLVLTSSSLDDSAAYFAGRDSSAYIQFVKKYTHIQNIYLTRLLSTDVKFQIH